MKNTITVNDTTFEAEVLKSELPTLVDLWAPWCGPCVQIGPVVEEIAGEFAGQFKVVYKDGSLRDRVVGTPGKKSIIAKLGALRQTEAAA